MAWPFSTAGAPNFDSGFTAVPSAPTNPPNADSVSTFWLMGGNFTNAGNIDAFVTLTDGTGNLVMGAVRIPAFSSFAIEWAFMPVVGLKWNYSSAALTGKLWGYV